jgi:hypothetical protein
MADGATKSLTILLRLNDQLSGRLGKSVSALRGFRKEADAALKSYSALRKEMGRGVSVSNLTKFDSKLKSVRTDAKGLSSDVSKLNTNLSKPVSTSGLDAAAKSARALRTQIQGVNSAMPSATRGRGAASQPSRGRGRGRAQGYQPGAWMGDSDEPRDWRRELRDQEPRRGRRREREGGFLARAEDLNTVIETTGQIKHAFAERVDSLEKYTDAYLELAQAQQRFYALNLKPEENKEAAAAVAETVKNLRGMTQAGTWEMLTDAHTGLGNLHHAIEALPMISKYRFGMSTLLGDKFSPEQIEGQIQQGLKMLEMIGAVRATGPLDEHGKKQFMPADRERMERYFARVTQMTAATGGRVTPAELYAMAQTGGTAVQGLSLEGLTALSGAVTEMGGSRTGTALQSLFQQIVAGRVQQKGLMEWQRLGLLDTSKVEYNKSGIVKSMQAGAIPIADELQQNPQSFADKLAEAMHKHGVDTSDPNAVIKELGALKMPRTAMEITSLFINQRDRMIKEAGLSTNAKDYEGLYSQGLNGPMGPMKEYEAQLTNFKAEVGKPLLEIATEFYKASKPVLTTLAEYPKTAAGVLILGKSISFLAETATGLKNAGQMLGYFNGIGSASRAASGEIAGVAAQAGGLRGVLSKLNNPVAISIGLTAASIFTIAEIAELMKWMEEKRKADEQLAGANKGNLSGIDRARQEFGEHGQKIPNEIWNVQASGALAKLNIDNQLKEALGGWTMGSFLQANNPFAPDPAYSGGPNRFFVPRATKEIQTRAPELREPEVMARVLRSIEGWKLPTDQRTQIDKALSAAFPASFKTASEAVANELAKVKPAADQVSDSFLRMGWPMAGFMSGLNDGQSAAAGFAARLNAIEFKPPSIFAYAPPPTSGGTGRNSFGIDPLNPFPLTPPTKHSAIGSVIQGDGVVNLHRGNVVFPAKLSRRKPGDWLETIRAAGQDAASYQGGSLSIHAPVEISIDGASEPTAVAAQVRDELRDHYARLEGLVNERTDRRRIERMLGHRKSIYKEKAA